MLNRITGQYAKERFLTNLDGRIVNHDSSVLADCVLCDISETGARLAILDPAEIPLEFNLHVPEEGAYARVRLVWSSGNECGVTFVD
ncbi:PilZ domain-containing protein [Microvirga puerhi]|uniref:PilZ domain-containing protein n=1 Tax=Microvirga puerhi TaxID=2876078 RepID=A0ABS7VNU2_9HYPH|nr:PilZ domain-containing protein [Microvirga puerhi]MBZ6076662.1 PilZ domain-containing protein [Microvirga puerhi]